jgi:type VI secretion system protein ImpA
MPIDVEALLQPISEKDPSGADLRYDPLTDQIKEARRREDDLNQGVWKRDVKTADYVLVIKLATEALGKRTKDLQIAAWLAEALLRREGVSGFRQGLELIRKLLETYWDTVYPQIEEDGDLELRATPLRWVGSQLDTAVRSAPLTQAGHNWYQYRESRSLPTEDEARSDSAKQQRRNDAVAGGAVTAEEFDKGFEATPVAASQKLYDNLTGLIQFVQDLDGYCDEKFGEAAPDFSPLRTSLEEVQQTARMLLIKKGGLQAAPQQAEAPLEMDQDLGPTETATEVQNFSAGSAPAPAAPRRARGGIDPADFDDAVERIIAVSRFLRREFPYSPAPYLMLRALRWGELRATGGYPDPTFLQPPASDVRIELKRLANEGNWNDVREKAEEATGRPCGRGWLDLQRYAVNACRYCGADAIAQAIVSELKALLSDFPQMTQWTLADDTPAANAETLQWLEENFLLPGATPPPPPPAQQEWIAPPPPERVVSETADGEPAPPDAYDLAMEAAHSGRVEEAFTILSREIAQERTGRARFLRKVQLAQVCLATGNDEIGRPILQELAEEIEQRRLQAWEGPEMIAQPLALLYRSLASAGDSDEERRKLYARICRLDPSRALSLGS